MMLCVNFLCDMRKNLTQEALYTSFVLGWLLGKVIYIYMSLVLWAKHKVLNFM
jgi:hypothetical protein